MTVITVNGRQFAIDEDRLLHFLKSNGQEIVSNNEKYNAETNNKFPNDIQILKG